MDKNFKKLKEKSKSGEYLKEIVGLLRYNLGTHKSTRLKRAGIGKSKSLLHNDISKKHADRLFLELNRRAKAVGKEASNRFRFVTILQAVTEPTIEEVEEAVKQLEITFKSVVGSFRLWSRGTIELEMVNLGILERIHKAKDDEGRKLTVLYNLNPLQEFKGLRIAADKNQSHILVHCHVIVDLGSHYEQTFDKLWTKAKRESTWTRSPYQIDIKSLFKNKAVSNNLRKIADYVTKGGNEQLRYNAGFGRDLAEDLEAKIWREGLGRSDKGGETIEDERGLTVLEVQQLDALYLWLMRRRSDRRGYLLATSDR